VSLQRDFWLGLNAKNQRTNEAVTELCVDLQQRDVVYVHFFTFYMEGARVSRDNCLLTDKGYYNRSSMYDTLRVHRGSTRSPENLHVATWRLKVGGGLIL